MVSQYPQKYFNNKLKLLASHSIRPVVVSHGHGINVCAFKKCDYHESLHVTTRPAFVPMKTSLVAVIFIS